MRAILLVTAFLLLEGSAQAQTNWTAVENGDFAGSAIVNLNANGDKRQFRFGVPGNFAAGRGDPLFEGVKTGNEYVGKAYAFRDSCGGRSYDATGTVDDDQRTVTLSGRAPVMDDHCRVASYRDVSLVLHFIDPNASTPGHYDAPVSPPSENVAQGIQCPYPSTYARLSNQASYCRCPDGSGYMAGTGCDRPGAPVQVPSQGMPVPGQGAGVTTQSGYQDSNARIAPQMGCNSAPDYFVSGVDRRASREIGVNVAVRSARPLQDQNVLNNLLDRAAAAGTAQCPSNNIVAVFVAMESTRIVTAWINRAGGQWVIVSNNIQQAIALEDSRLRAASFQEEQKRKAEADAAAFAQKKQAALADCGSGPVFSGGPWFSSTYKTAAIGMGRSPDGRFLCVKSIEYVGPAVNPFGGNAARANFSGYDRFTLQPISMVMDFPY